MKGRRTMNEDQKIEEFFKENKEQAKLLAEQTALLTTAMASRLRVQLYKSATEKEPTVIDDLLVDVFGI